MYTICVYICIYIYIYNDLQRYPDSQTLGGTQAFGSSEEPRFVRPSEAPRLSDRQMYPGCQTLGGTQAFGSSKG